MAEIAPEDTSRLDDPFPASGAGGLWARSQELLDFGAVRRALAGHIAFPGARELALGLEPSYSAEEVERLQEETGEGRRLLAERGGIHLGGAGDTSEAVKRASLDGALTGAELLAVAASLEVQRRARSAVPPATDELPRLAAIAAQIPDLHELEQSIRGRIGDRGEILDDATPALRGMRRRVGRTYDHVTQALTRIISSAAGRDALQDQVISVRGDRLVVQVKAEMRQRLPGIVHDASNTGATLFIEPFSTVELCNAWREATLEEAREVERVLRELSSLVGAYAEDIRQGAERTASLDFILARARYSEAIRGVSVPSSPRRRSETAVRLLNARHPLLADDAVPINVGLGPGWSVLVITGPNTGGKTVAMKTVGLMALMHQCGIQVPADEGSLLSVFDGVYADVGDQQSIERSVSTFSSHMRNVIDILAEAGPDSLVLLDEIGTSTDPEEGSALAKAVLGHLAERGVRTIATTHHRSVAAFAESTDGMMNASVELDSSTLRPTYKLTMGVPGRSYAMSVAARMGLPGEIMERAGSLLEPQHMRFEDWLSELQREREKLQSSLQEADQSRARAETARLELEAQIEHLVSHREDILDGVRKDLVARYEDVRRQLRRAEAALSWRVPGADLQQVKHELSDVKCDLEAVKLPESAPGRNVERKGIQVGDLVSVRGLNLQGTVASLGEGNTEAEVNVGNVRLQVEMRRLSRVEEAPENPTAEVSFDLGPGLSSMELDMRGLRVQETLIQLEEFMDKAVRDGLSSVRIIHGRGTGVLRQVVREHLARHPLAKSVTPESPDRGGDGATAVELA